MFQNQGNTQIVQSDDLWGYEVEPTLIPPNYVSQCVPVLLLLNITNTCQCWHIFDYKRWWYSCALNILRGMWIIRHMAPSGDRSVQLHLQEPITVSSPHTWCKSIYYNGHKTTSRYHLFDEGCLINCMNGLCMMTVQYFSSAFLLFAWVKHRERSMCKSGMLPHVITRITIIWTYMSNLHSSIIV